MEESTIELSVLLEWSNFEAIGDRKKIVDKLVNLMNARWRSKNLNIP